MRMVDVICKVVFGIVLIGAGVYHIVIYVKGKINATLMDMFSGVLLFVLGGFLFFKSTDRGQAFTCSSGRFCADRQYLDFTGMREIKKQKPSGMAGIYFNKPCFCDFGNRSCVKSLFCSKDDSNFCRMGSFMQWDFRCCVSCFHEKGA